MDNNKLNITHFKTTIKNTENMDFNNLTKDMSKININGKIKKKNDIDVNDVDITKIDDNLTQDTINYRKEILIKYKDLLGKDYIVPDTPSIYDMSYLYNLQCLDYRRKTLNREKYLLGADYVVPETPALNDMTVLYKEQYKEHMAQINKLLQSQSKQKSK